MVAFIVTSAANIIFLDPHLTSNLQVRLLVIVLFHSRYYGCPLMNLMSSLIQQASALIIRKCFLPYSWKYWQEINLAGDSQIAITNILARFKFGSLVQDRHTSICIEEIWWLEKPTAKLPNFPAILRHQGWARIGVNLSSRFRLCQ